MTIRYLCAPAPPSPGAASRSVNCARRSPPLADHDALARRPAISRHPIMMRACGLSADLGRGLRRTPIGPMFQPAMNGRSSRLWPKIAGVLARFHSRGAMPLLCAFDRQRREVRGISGSPCLCHLPRRASRFTWGGLHRRHGVWSPPSPDPHHMTRPSDRAKAGAKLKNGDR